MTFAQIPAGVAIFLDANSSGVSRRRTERAILALIRSTADAS
jgi:hypothetical protein